MADDDNTALQDSEQDSGSMLGGDSSLSDPSQMSGGFSQGQPPPTPQTPPQGAANAGNGDLPGGGVRSGPDDAEDQPRVSGRAMFLGNLLKTILGGVATGVGMANPKSRAAFQNAQQAPQRAAQTQAAMSEADIARQNASMAGLKVLLTKHMVDRLPQEDQDKFMDMSNTYYKALRDDEGMEVETVGDPKAASAEAGRLNTTDARVKAGLGTYQPIIHRDDDGKRVASVIFFGNKDVLQHDVNLGPNPNYDPDGPDDDDTNPKDLVVKANTPMKGFAVAAKMANDAAKGLTKDQTKQLADALKPNVPEGEIPQTLAWLQNHKEQNTSLYQANKNRMDAQINTLNAARGMIQSDKLAQAHAMRADAAATKDSELTSSTKTMTEAAPRVLGLVDRVDKLVDEQTKTLGPAASRWQEYMAGKVGAPNPEFTKLRTDVGLLTTLLMRMHVGARGGEYIMKHFQDLIDTGKQSPENLKAALGEIRTYAQDVQAEGKGGGNPAAASKPNGKAADTSGFDPSLFPKAQ